MQQPIKMRWHKAYMVILVILGVVRVLGILSSIGEYVMFKLTYTYLTDYQNMLMTWWLVGIVIDVVIAALMFVSFAKLKNFAPGAIGVHTALLVLFSIVFALGFASRMSEAGYSFFVQLVVGFLFWTLLEVPVWIYYHKRRILYECSEAMRNHLLYGTPMPEFKTRVLEDHSFRTYSSQPTQTLSAPPAQQPVQPKRQLVQVHKKGEAPVHTAEPRNAQPQSLQQQINFCRFCGCKLLPDAIYCTKCGAKIQTEEKSC